MLISPCVTSIIKRNFDKLYYEIVFLGECVIEKEEKFFDLHVILFFKKLYG